MSEKRAKSYGPIYERNHQAASKNETRKPVKRSLQHIGTKITASAMCSDKKSRRILSNKTDGITDISDVLMFKASQTTTTTKQRPKVVSLKSTSIRTSEQSTTSKRNASKRVPNKDTSLIAAVKSLSPDIIRVWEGYIPEETDTERDIRGPIFVAIVKKKIDNLDAKQPDMGSIRIIQRLTDEVSDETKQCSQKEASLDITLDENDKLRDTLLRHSGDLLKAHSNLQLVSASKLKSIENGSKTKKESCVVLYVHVKGIIPINEPPFPKQLEQFPVDVREGVYTNYSDQQLAIGSTFRGNTNHGKIAGFVNLPTGNMGCLTCAHVFDIHEPMETGDVNEDSTESVTELVYQYPSRTPFGKLYKHKNEPGGPTKTGYKTGIDAALIEITDKLRYPKDGNYKHSVSSTVACDGTLDYDSGQILTSLEEVAKMHIAEKMKCKIVRYNEDKKKLYVRTGRINADVASLAAWWPLTSNEKCQLHAQIHIQPDHTEIVDGIEDQSFATYGDSGSLVFLTSEDGEHIWAFGMVVGGIEADGSAIVTPIWEVLDAFGLPRKFMSFKYAQVNNLGNQVKKLSDKVDKMDEAMKVMGENIKQILTNTTTKNS